MLSSLGYLGISAPEPDAWRGFATGVLGAAVVDDAEGGLRLRMDDHGWRIDVVAGTGDLEYVGWQVADVTMFDRVEQRLMRAGVHVVRDEELAERRGVSGVLRCTDPVGTPVEIFHGPQIGREPFSSPTGSSFVTGALGLGHVVIGTSEPEELQRFYREVLDFRVTDTFRRTAFMRVNSRHHSLAIGHLPGARYALRHFMLELTELSMVGRALDAAMDAPECSVTRSLGQHTNDRMISFYATTPSGFEVEVGCGGLFVDDETWSTSAHATATAWGHRPVASSAPAGPPNAQPGTSGCVPHKWGAGALVQTKGQ